MHAPDRPRRASRCGTEIPPRADPSPTDRPAAPQRFARTAVALVCLAAAAAGFGWASRSRTGDRTDGSVHLDRDGFRYTFHTVTGDEALFDVRNDPRLLRNVIRQEPARAAELRRALERAHGVESLEELRAAHRAEIEALEAFGYL